MSMIFMLGVAHRFPYHLTHGVFHAPYISISYKLVSLPSNSRMFRLMRCTSTRRCQLKVYVIHVG